MATRKVKDAKDLSTNELIYFKGHAKATYMSDGRTVEDAINDIPSSGGGGGGETGPQGPQGEQGPKGEDGVGIASVVQTTTSSADGGSNVMTVTLSDGKTSTFTVKNGSKGSQGEKGDKGDTGAEGPQGVQGIQGIQGPKGDKGDKGDTGATGANGTNGKDGADGATFTPSVDATGNLSWTNNKGLTNPPTVNIKGPKGDSGEGGGNNTYITDFKVEDLFALLNGNIDQLQIDAQGLADALYNHKNILVPYYNTPTIGGKAILLGEYDNDDAILFTVYTHISYVFYCEAFGGVIYNSGIYGSDVTAETVKQTHLDTLTNVAIANAVQTDGLLYAFPDQATGEEDDVLLSRGKTKTINGQFLFVDGNSNDIITTYKRITTTSPSVELLPNTIIEWPMPIQSQELVLTFGEQPPQGYAVEYIAKFNVGADGVQLIVPDNVVWADGILPAMTKGKTYEISFVDNLATFLEF